MDERSRYRLFEDQFLQQLRARALALTRGKLPADDVEVEPTPEAFESVRAELGRLEVYDRGALDSMPGTTSVQMRFTRRVLGGLLRSTVSRLRARVLVPIAQLVNNETPGPIGREQVLDALAQYQVLPKNQRPTGVVLASATGFTEEARSLVESTNGPTLVLMGGRVDGGWDAALPQRLKKTPWAKLFELESQDDRLKRLMYHLNQDKSLIDSRGVTVAELSEKLGVPSVATEALVRRACRQDPRLMTVVHDGKTHVCRSPLAEEGNTMTIWSRIRKLLGFKPTVAERVREMTGQRVRIEQERHELDQRVDSLEGEERDLLERGAAAKSTAEKKQVAGKLVRARRELKRVRGQRQIFSQQIDIIGTQIHNLTLAEQGKRIALPKAEDLTAAAAEAEQVVAELAANAELAQSIEVTGETPMMADEEAAIMAEFDEINAADTEPAAADEEPTSAGPLRDEEPTRGAPAQDRAPGAAQRTSSGERSPEAN